MSLSWNQIKVRAAKFSKEWKDALYEKGEAQSFYNAFFEVFGIQRRSVARFEEHVKKLNKRSGFIDLFWPGVLLVEQKSAGKDLAIAANQAGEYFDALSEGEKPRYQLVCDFQFFILLDRETGKVIEFKLEDLHNNVENFAFMVGKQSSLRHPKTPVNINAAKLISTIYEGLTKSGYAKEDLEKCLTRLVFCLFADDTGIFQPRGIFEDLIDSRTNQDGSDLGSWLVHLFQVLNTPEVKREINLDSDLAQFPYINGGLFSEPIFIPSFNEQMRLDLLKACQSDWSAISPAIFGALFQSVLSKAEQRETGSYFTSEENIKKVVNDLFLLELRNEFEQLRIRKFKLGETLERFQKKLGQLEFLDPACGCGNFLAVAYHEIRKLEIDVLCELKKLNRLNLDSPELSVVDVCQFNGIEQRSYSTRIAETAMWMVDHISNNELSLSLGVEYYRVPLEKSPNIYHGDALSKDWHEIMSPGQMKFILGNPPYGGAKVQSESERKIIREIAQLGGSGGTLDRVCGWIIKAVEYLNAGTKIGLVTINSIVQGEQVGQLWEILYDRFSVDISFAHQSFIWESESSKDAHVQVIILGLNNQSESPSEKRLYEYSNVEGKPNLVLCKTISPYLISGDRLKDYQTIVHETSNAINGFKKLKTGTKPIDGGYYILTESEKKTLQSHEPYAEKFIYPFIGGKEFLKGQIRYIIILKDATPGDLRQLPYITGLIKKVREYRQGLIMNKAGTKKLNQPNELMEKPRQFHITSIPKKPFLVIPEVTSERRSYIPIAWMQPPFVPSNLVKFLDNATLVDFALLTSAMHMAWVRGIAGKLEGRNRYSIRLAYNTFPIPNNFDIKLLESHAQGILDARSESPNQTLENLYDPDLMPLNLKKAHQKLDRQIDRIYLGRDAKDDQDRLENLLNRYFDMTN